MVSNWDAWNQAHKAEEAVKARVAAERLLTSGRSRASVTAHNTASATASATMKRLDAERKGEGEARSSAQQHADRIKEALGGSSESTRGAGSSTVSRPAKKDFKRAAPVKGEKDTADSARTTIRMAAYNRTKKGISAEDEIGARTPRTEIEVNPHTAEAAKNTSAEKLVGRHRAAPSEPAVSDKQTAHYSNVVAPHAERASTGAKTSQDHLDAAVRQRRAAELAPTEDLRARHTTRAAAHDQDAARLRAQESADAQRRSEAAAAQKAKDESRAAESAAARARLAQRAADKLAGSTSKSVEDTAEEIRQQNPDVKLSVSRSGAGHVTVHSIVLPNGERGQGRGGSIMKRLTDAADANGDRMALSPSKDFGASSVSRLQTFYKGHGFVPNTGRSRDLSVSETMIREPRSLAHPAVTAQRSADRLAATVNRDPETDIRAAVHGLADEPGGWVGLKDVRTKLSGYTRQEQDDALRQIAMAKDVHVIPVANLKSLTPADRAAELHMGGEANHAISIEGVGGRPAAVVKPAVLNTQNVHKALEGAGMRRREKQTISRDVHGNILQRASGIGEGQYELSRGLGNSYKVNIRGARDTPYHAARHDANIAKVKTAAEAKGWKVEDSNRGYPGQLHITPAEAAQQTSADKLAATVKQETRATAAEARREATSPKG